MTEHAAAPQSEELRHRPWLAAVLSFVIPGLGRAITYGVSRIFGTGAVGTVLISIVALLLVAYAFARRSKQGAPVPAS